MSGGIATERNTTKKILTNLLDVLVLLPMMVPTVSFLREKLRLAPDDTPEWTDRAGDWLIKTMN